MSMFNKNNDSKEIENLKGDIKELARELNDLINTLKIAGIFYQEDETYLFPWLRARIDGYKLHPAYLALKFLPEKFDKLINFLGIDIKYEKGYVVSKKEKEQK